MKDFGGHIESLDFFFSFKVHIGIFLIACILFVMIPYMGGLMAIPELICFFFVLIFEPCYLLFLIFRKIFLKITN